MNGSVMVLMMTGYSHRIFNYRERSHYFLYSVFTRARCLKKKKERKKGRKEGEKRKVSYYQRGLSEIFHSCKGALMLKKVPSCWIKCLKTTQLICVQIDLMAFLDFFFFSLWVKAPEILVL